MVYGEQRTPDYEKRIVKLMLPTLQVENVSTCKVGMVNKIS